MGMELIQRLFADACPSIRYRAGRDLLDMPVHSPSMEALQQEILADDKVREVFSWQGEDGWLGGYLHGEREPETGIRLLIEKGVEGDNPIIAAALAAILERGGDFDRGSLERVGKQLDAYRLGGSKMIKACVFAYAGREDAAFIREQIAEALFGFSFTLNIADRKELYRMHKDKIPVFRDGMLWPGIYHLRLLACTKSWRTTENLQMLGDAFNHMLSLCPIPAIRLLHKGQPMAPALMDFVNTFHIPQAERTAADWMLWFQRAELVARLGIVPRLPVLWEQTAALKAALAREGWRFTKPLSHYYFHKWSPYTGLALENDWRNKNRRIYDLTFRSLLILKHCEGLGF